MRYWVGILMASSFIGAVSAPLAPSSNAKDSVAARDSIIVASSAARTSTPAPATFFTGRAQVEQLFGAHDASRMTAGTVTFQAGARSAWHTHPLGQILIVTAGEGLVQQWGSPAHLMKSGDVVWIPAGVKHWHGASASSSVTHLALQELVDGRAVDWLEQVTDEQYAAGAQARR